MPLAVVEQLADKLVQAIDDAAGGFALAGRSMYVLDGSSLISLREDPTPSALCAQFFEIRLFSKRQIVGTL